MLRIVYLAHINVRSPRAHAHNTLKTCEALATAGAQVLFVNADAVSAEEWRRVCDAHAIRPSFETRFLGTVPADAQNDPSRPRRLFAILRTNFSLAFFLWRERKNFDVLYYRYHLFLAQALFVKWILRKPVFFESHYVYIKKKVAQAITSGAIRSANGVVAITEALRRFYRLSDKDSIMSPCHAAEHALLPTATVPELRKTLDLPADKTVLCYTGSLGATIQGISYEVETLVNVLADLPPSYASVIVGAREDRPQDVAELRTLAEKLGVGDRVLIRPWSERRKAMEYLAAADVLMMPRVGVAPGSSPSKMFDYLPVGKPIVAARTPPVAEILRDGGNALLVDADRPEEWAAAVRRLVDEPGLASRLAEGAKEDSFEYTWEARGRRIASFIRSYVA